MNFENYWEVLLSGIVIWLFVDEFVMKPATAQTVELPLKKKAD